VVGRGEGLGRPLLYGTTRHFLEHFGFRSLEDLPRPEELPVILRDRVPLGPPEDDVEPSEQEELALTESTPPGEEEGSRDDTGDPGGGGTPPDASADGDHGVEDSAEGAEDSGDSSAGPGPDEDDPED
jgi:hypothetical protein